MSFVENSSQQISLFEMLAFLSRRKQQMLEKSWAKVFSDQVFSKIDEYIFAPLYSEKTNSRPNAPVNVLVGALILKDLNGLTDDELEASCLFDFRYQYALHTASFEDQPVSKRTLSRFRSRLAAYELTTGEDLLHKCFVDLSDGMRRFMDISPDIMRMDSMMIESSIRKMGRLELLYTCLANLVKELHRDGRLDLTEGIEHYADANDRNKVIYHDDETPKSEKLQKVINDAVELLPKCADEYADTEDYQLLERAISEQTKKDDSGKNVPKDKSDGMDSSILQNPADPDATYRAKAGKDHRGYVANITEAVSENGSIATDYQYEVNTHSDKDFLREVIEEKEPAEDVAAIIADGAYASEEVSALAAEKNIAILTTSALGRSPREILSQFRLTDDGLHVASCPEGYEARSSSYVSQTDSIRASFPRSCCENCEHREECLASLKPRTAMVNIPLKSRERAVQMTSDGHQEDIALIARIRNGVETIPSILRRKYHVDEMPVRGKLKTKIRFGFKLLALNFTKVWLFTKGMEKCRAYD